MFFSRAFLLQSCFIGPPYRALLDNQLSVRNLETLPCDHRVKSRREKVSKIISVSVKGRREKPKRKGRALPEELSLKINRYKVRPE